MIQVKLGFALALCAGALSVFGVAALQPGSGVSTWTESHGDSPYLVLSRLVRWTVPVLSRPRLLRRGAVRTSGFVQLSRKNSMK